MEKHKEGLPVSEQNVEQVETRPEINRVINVISRIETTSGVLFEDCVYTDVECYINFEVIPFLNNEKPLAHIVNKRDIVQILNSLTTNSPQNIAALLELAKKIGSDDESLTTLYSEAEKIAYFELLLKLLVRKTTRFTASNMNDLEFGYDVKKNKKYKLFSLSPSTLEVMREMMQKYDLESDAEDQDSVVNKLKEQIDADPQAFLIELINNLPVNNAFKHIFGLKFDFFKKYKERIDKTTIMQTAEKLDENKYREKRQIISALEDCFQD